MPEARLSRERWDAVSPYLDRALEMSGEERASWLRRLETEDPGLAADLHLLIEERDALSREGFLHGQAPTPGRAASDDTATFVGRQMGPYVIQAPLGAGGMGEVFRARDTRLGRDVAIKVLPEAWLRDPERRARFDREARALAALNHPHIGAIYGFEDQGDVRGLVLELVEGQTLKERIAAAAGGLPIPQALAFAAQIAGALAAAHERGIIHRDLKPANIMITPDDRVKVLDFGLAKVSRSTGGDVDPGGPRPPDLTGTREGMILGTAAYMSPEQARGKPVDKRTDAWAFGCVLYEMLSGRAAFTGETLTDTLAAVLEREPRWDALPRRTPPSVRRLLERCLDKDVERRLDDLAGATRLAQAAPAAGHGRWVSRGVAVAAVLAAVVAVGVRWRGERLGGPKGASTPALRLEKLTNRGNAESVAVSPDGRYLAYSSSEGGQATVWLRDVRERTETRLASPPGAEYITDISFARDGQSISYSFPPRTGERPLYRVPLIGGEPRLVYAGWGLPSPDGKRVAFSRTRGDANALFVAGLESGREEEIAGLDRRGVPSSWSPDGTQLAVSERAGLSVMQADGSGRRTVAECSAPTWWSPDGRSILCSIGDTQLLGVDLVTGEKRSLGDRTWRQVNAVQWLPDGTSFLVNGSDDKGLSSIHLVSYPGGKVGKVPATTHEYKGLGLTADGKEVVSVQSVQRSDISVSSDPGNGPFRRIVTGTDGDYRFCWTPEGRIVYASNEGGSYDLYVLDADGSNKKQLTFDRIGNETEPAASPDGRHIVFVSDRGGEGTLYRINQDGTDLKALTPQTAPRYPDRDPRVTPDSGWVLYRHRDNGFSVWKVPMEGGAPVLVKGVRPAPTGGMVEQAFGASASPDGRHLAFFHFLLDMKAATSMIDVVVALPDGRIVKRFPYAETRRGGISAHEHVQWSRDGSALYYLNMRKGNHDLWKQSVGGGPPVQVTRFEEPVQYCDWSFDGKTLACARSLTLRDVVKISNFR